MRSFIIMLMVPFLSSAQFTDNFGDGDFTGNPVWTGDVADFKINTAFQLQLNQTVAPPAGVSDTSFLVTENQCVDSAEWTFWVKLSFSPSDNNYAVIYLVADQDNLKAPVNGYYIRLGESGSFDSIDLFRQDGITSFKIIDGVDGHCAASSNIVRIKVMRHSSGLWEVFSDISGGMNYQPEGSATDTTYISSSYAGIFCKYTSSNTTKFYFDDFFTGNIQVDIQPPKLVNFSVTGPVNLDLLFSEPLEQQCAETELNYIVNNGLGSPLYAILEANDNSQVHLTFTAEIQSAVKYSLAIQNISDISGNILHDTTITFMYYLPQPFDVVINEIMVDPNPVVDLPDYEYIELFNTSEFDITMPGWRLSAGAVTRTIPDVTIRTDSFLILCSTAAAPEFSAYGKTLGITGFPSLTNTGQTVIIADSNGVVISTVSYTDKWYQDPVKEDGGWSLEKIDPRNNCSQSANWKASVNPSGGTPGQVNSMYSSNIDNQPPSLIAIEVNDSNIIRLEFSESLGYDAATDISNYSAGIGIGNPDSAILSGSSSTLVHLFFSQNFTPGQENSLLINDMTDLCNNLMDSLMVNFTFYIPEEFDIVINEIMADPEPTVGLPAADYIELYNNSNYDISLSDWSLTIGSKKYYFPFLILESGGFLIVTYPAAAASLCVYGNTTGIISSADITIEGKTITLRDRNGKVVSTVTYSSGWYQVAGKDNGGWSLEQIDPGNPCGGKSNWMASSDLRGGTPGELNSVFAANPDLASPVLERATVLTASSIKIFFSEPLDSITLMDVSAYQADNGGGVPVSVTPVGPDYRCVILNFAGDFQENIIYTINVTTQISDCVGNFPGNICSARFSIPKPVESSDMVINEILFDPKDDGADFVEVYNRSSKTICLDEIIIAAVNSSSDPNADTIPEEKYLLFPADYLVFSADPDKVKEQYFTRNPAGFICMKSMPSFSNDSGRILIMTCSQLVIDDLSYNKDMHFALLDNAEGVSLERINFDYQTNDRSNWHSAAETEGFATPAYKNSQYSDFTDSENEISLSPEVFSPNNDGIDDYLTISYLFDNPGYIGTIIIFDSKGRTVKNLVNHELLATGGCFTWDGLNGSGQMAGIGIYLVYVEVFNLKGDVKKYKKPCVLAGKMD